MGRPNGRALPNGHRFFLIPDGKCANAFLTAKRAAKVAEVAKRALPAYDTAQAAASTANKQPRTVDRAITKEGKRCEACGAFHDGSYGSGRFCSQSCRSIHNRGGPTHTWTGVKEADSAPSVGVKEAKSAQSVGVCNHCGDAFQLRGRAQKFCK